MLKSDVVIQRLMASSSRKHGESLRRSTPQDTTPRFSVRRTSRRPICATACRSRDPRLTLDDWGEASVLAPGPPKHGHQDQAS